MRDPNRIPTILKALEQIWKANPDFRLGQLIMVGTKPKEPCPELFYIEDEDLLEGLLKFDKNVALDNGKDESIDSWSKFSNISRIAPQELTIELLKQLIIEIKNSNKNIVITPINLMKLNGAPVSDQSWILSQKQRINTLKKLLVELNESGLLNERKNKQDFLGIKETGYDIVD